MRGREVTFYGRTGRLSPRSGSVQLGIGHDPGQHAAYVKSWVQILKEDPKEILPASRDADKISNYVLGLEKDRMPANIEKLPEVPRAQPQPARRSFRVCAPAGRDR